MSVDPKVLDAAVRGVLMLLASGALGDAVAAKYRLCNPRCRAAVRGLVERTDEMREVAELAGDHADKIMQTLIAPDPQQGRRSVTAPADRSAPA